MQVVRRVGLIGDVHREEDALAFALTELGRLGTDAVLQVGDIADGQGDLNATVALLELHQVLAVRGNRERWLLGGQLRDLPYATELTSVAARTLDYLTRLPVTRDFRSPRGDVLLCHGLGLNDMVGVKPDHAVSARFPRQCRDAAARSRALLFARRFRARRAGAFPPCCG